ncbi:glycosyltransferase family 4 protein [Salinigranum halophilum]|uniref:glycosyltransferase family 4 protein n=1 Tax=Salinigranum halophilum TaxID=2565931 RepID=UPI00115E0F61|nr:glycosyltransferase family 4 protein [Salinigranum halophilum]
MSDPQPNVLVVSQKFPPEKGGNASRLGDLTKHMASDVDLTVIAPPQCYPATDFDWSWVWETAERRNGHRLHRLWSWQLRSVDPSFIERMLYYFTFVAHALLWLFWRRKEFDVVVTSSPPIFTGMVAAPFQLLGYVDWVVDIRDLWIDVSTDLGFISENAIVTRLSHAYQEFELNTAQLITVTTDGTTTQLRSRYDFDTEVELIPNGVDVTMFQPDDSATEVDLIYTGNIGYGQDLETCIKALQYTDGEVTLRLVGDGDLRSELSQLAEELGVSHRVEFTGLVNREEIPGYLSSARIGLAPLKRRDSLSYAVPTKLYEYWACELPVLALGTGAIEEIVVESEAGIVPDGTPTVVASEIDSLLADASRLDEMGTVGREFILEKYERKAIAQKLSQRIIRLHEDIDG